MEKMKLYLHIGMGKTGTTALQSFFWRNREVLALEGIDYPEIGVVAGAHHLLSPHVPRFLANKWSFESASDWAPELAKSLNGNALVSSELMVWASPEAIQHYCEVLLEWFDLHVVIYLRRQDQIIEASYNQQVKAGQQKKHLNQTYLQLARRFNYSKLLAPWVDALGEDRICVRPFERQQFYQGDIRSDFLHHVFGLELDDRFQLDRGNSNPRLSPAGIEYHRLINNLAIDESSHEVINSLLLQYSAEFDASSLETFSSHQVLSGEQRAEIMELVGALNTDIANRFLPHSNGRLFYEQPEHETGASAAQVKVSAEEFTSISLFVQQRDPVIHAYLVELAERETRNVILEVRTAAYTLLDALHPESKLLARSTRAAAPVMHDDSGAARYAIAGPDEAPIVVGGLGDGSLPLVSQLLQRSGVSMGGHLMPSYDNLWFTLLFVRRVTLLMSDEDVQKLAWIFVNATRYGGTVPGELRELVDQAMAYDRSPVFPREYLLEGFRTLTEMPRELLVSSADTDQGFWGWKQANTHVLLPVLNRCFPRMKYIYVYRNCLHVGFNGNYNQLKYLWGNIFLEGEVKDKPSHLVRYWLTSHKRMLGMQQSMQGRLYMLDYDQLCREPELELEALSEFLGMDVVSDKIAALRELVPAVETPHPIGPAELAQLGQEQLAELRAMGQLDGM